MEWKGPVAYRRSLAALDEAGIPSFEVTEHDPFATVLQIAAPARQVIAAALQSESKE